MSETNSGTPHEIAFKLMEKIALAEGRYWTNKPGQGHQAADRKWTLDAFRECMWATSVTKKPAGAD